MGSVTTFKVTPVNDGQQARVQITTEWPVRPGITGWVERVMTGRLLRSVYTKELQQLAAYVTTEHRSISSAEQPDRSATRPNDAVSPPLSRWHRSSSIR